MTDVMNLSTGKVYTYSTNDPRKALMLCHQQITRKNFNTWDYAFNEPINESSLCYYIGDLAVYKDGRRIK